MIPSSQASFLAKLWRLLQAAEFYKRFHVCIKQNDTNLGLVQPCSVNVASNVVTLGQATDRTVLIEFVIRAVIAQCLISFLEMNFEQ